MTQPSASTASAPQLTERRAILVDDDPVLLRLIKTWLTGIGFIVETFTQFEPAQVRLQASAPHVLITDVRLGAFNGLQLAVLAKLTHPEIVTIVLTGFDDPVIIKAARDAGSVFLAKPVRSEQLIDVVETYSSLIL